jgi:hypothetical protein
MNTEMTGGVIRHIITMLAGAVIANGESLDTVMPSLLHNIASGDVNAIAASSVMIFAILWSMWTKLTEEKKDVVMQSLRLKKEND